MELGNNAGGRPRGLTLMNAACGIVAAISVATSLIVTGSQFAAGGPSASNVVMALLNVAMLLLMFFVAWNTGRASVRKADFDEPQAPAGDPDRGRPEEPVSA